MALLNKMSAWIAVASTAMVVLFAVVPIQNNCFALNPLKADSAVRPTFVEFAIKEILVDLLVAEDAAEEISKELIRWSANQYEAEKRAESDTPSDGSFAEYTIIRLGSHVAPKKYTSKQGDGILFVYIDMTNGAVNQKDEAYLVTMCECDVASKKMQKGAFVLKKAIDAKFEVSSMDADDKPRSP